jgi:hypothetical protein
MRNFVRRRWLLLVILTVVAVLMYDASRRFDCGGGALCWQHFPIPVYSNPMWRGYP